MVYVPGSGVAIRFGGAIVTAKPIGCSMSPCSENRLHIRLKWWIGASLSLMRMEPSRRDLYVSWIVGTRIC